MEIEFIRPNEAAFGAVGDLVDEGDDTPASFDDEQRPRWLAAVAGLVVLVLLAGGVIAAAPWDSGDTAPAPTTTERTSETSEPPSTTPVLSTTAPDPLEGQQLLPRGWVAEPPVGWQLSGGYSNRARPLDGWIDPSQTFEVWAAPGATRTTGTWISLRAGPFAFTQLLANGTRFTTGDRLAAVTTTPSGVQKMTVQLPSQAELTIEGFGVAFDQLLRIATELQPATATDPIDYGTLLEPGGPFDGLELVSDASVLLYGTLLTANDAEATVVSDDQSMFVGIGLGRRPRAADPLLPVLMERITDRPDVASIVAGIDATTGRTTEVYDMRDVGGPDSYAVTWPVGDATYDDDATKVITVVGYGAPLTDVLDLAASARPADEDEWREVLLRSYTQPDTEDSSQLPPEATFGGEFSDGYAWRGNLTLGYVYASTLSGRSTWSAGPFGRAPEPVTRVLRYAGPDLTMIVAFARWPDTSRSMRLTVGGQVLEPIPMEPLGREAVVGAIYLSREDVPIVVELLDADGAVRAVDPAP